MRKEAIRHIPMSEDAYAMNEQRVIFRIRTARDDLTTCTLYYGDRSCRQTPVLFTGIPMEVVAQDTMFDYYEIDFNTPYKRICYYFELCKENEKTFYYGDFFHEQLVDDRSEYYQLPFVHREDIAKVPGWVYNAIVYQIFPDSFATSREYISQKAVETEYQGYPVRGKLGGTIRGITENVDYLVRLGINCIYINPLFTAGEYHKYDLLDYYSIDPAFGDNHDFKELVDTMHKNEIRVIIDGVFNHCGWNFFAFEDVVRNGENSKYKDWFYEVKYPVIKPDNMEDIPGYDCFGYERLMPKLNTANPEVIEYFCNVGRYWIQEYKIDGWRLDVASEVNDDFWRCFRKAVKEVSPEALLIGEVWESASHWLDGSMFDSTMNYDMRRHCRRFFADNSIDAAEFDGRVTNMRMRYRKQILSAQLNLLDSHDVSRFFSLCQKSVKKYKLAVLFQMCFCGMPSIFYGDEQGLWGINEEDYRQPIKWSEEHSLFEFYQKVIALRKKHKGLKYGDYKTLYARKGCSLYVFSREYENEKIIIALNASSREVQWEAPKGKRLMESFVEGNVISAYGYLVIQNMGDE